MKSGAAECGRRGGRLRAITFDIRNYSSADAVRRRRGRLRGHSAGVRGAGQRGRALRQRPPEHQQRLTVAPRRARAAAAIAPPPPTLAHFTYTAEIYTSLD